MTRVNLLGNPSFRAGLTNYASFNGAKLDITTDYAFYGGNAMLVTKTTQNNSGLTTVAPIPVVAGMPYAASVYVRLPSGIPAEEPANLVLSVVWLNSVGTVVSTSQSVVYDLADASTWVRLAGVWTAPLGATVAQIQLTQLVGGTAGARFVADGFLFEQANYVGGYLDNLTQAEENKIVNKALSSPVPQILNGLELNADVLMNDLVLNTIDEDGVVWICTGIDGWYGQSAPELPNIARGTEDGSYDVSGRYAARVITVRGVFFPPSNEALGAARDRLVTAVNLVRKGGWLRTNEEPTKAAYVRLSGQPQIETVNARGRTEFSIGFRAGDPIKYHWNDADPEGYSHQSVSEGREGIRTNLIPNPSMEGSAAVVDVYRNIATNPSMETGGAAFTMRTNLIPNPRFGSSSTGWNFGGAGTIGSRVASAPTLARPAVLLPRVSANVSTVELSPRVAVTPGATYTLSALALIVPSGGQVSIDGAFYDSAGTLISWITRSILSTVGTPTRWNTTPTVAPANAATIMVRAYRDSGSDGDVYVTDFMFEAASVVQPYFDGATPAVGDFTYAWSGTADASTSVQRGIPVTGIGTNKMYSSLAIQSTDWSSTGTKSLRLIGLKNDTTESMVFAQGGFGELGGMTAGKTYTATAKLRLNAPLAAYSSASLRMRIRWSGTGLDGGILSNQAPNAVGVYELRVTATVPAAATSIIIEFDQFAPGETWWDDLAIVEVGGTAQPYTGPYFDGSTLPGDDYTYAWFGTANGSASVQRATSVGSLTTGNSFAVQSSNWAKSGTKSLRIVPSSTSASSDSYARRELVGLVQEGKTYTVMATLRLAVPQTGTSAGVLQSRNLFLDITGGGNAITRGFGTTTQSPNTPGEYQHRLVFTVPNVVGSPVTALGVRLYNGSTAGDVYWDNLLVVEGDYTGAFFDGNTKSLNGEKYTWLGVPNASSTLRVPGPSVVGSVLNIGTADVTGLFTLTGPLGAGSSIYNAATNETASTIKPLRGKGIVGTIQTSSVTDNIATIKTTANHQLIEGDFIYVTGAGLPFDTVGAPAVVLAASNVFPYTISYAVQSDYMEENSAVGQVQLANNDELTIDTYNRVVTFNGTSVGQRSKLETLTDWIKFAPGVNTLEFFDEVSKLEITAKSTLNGLVTLTTSDVHYLIPGEAITVNLGETVALSKKSLTNNVVTLTTATPHGFSLGDKISVNSTERSAVDQKSATTTVATLRTVDPNGVSLTDTILVNLPLTATPVAKELTNNVAKITTSTAHGFSAGDTVTISLPSSNNITQKSLTNDQATITTSTAHNYQIGDSITVSLNGYGTIVRKAKSGASAVITTSVAHGFSSGDVVYMNLPASATLANIREIKGGTVVRYNRIPNPSGRRGTQTYSVTGGVLGQDSAADTYVFSTTAGVAGSKSLRFGQIDIGSGLLPNTLYTLSANVYVVGQPSILPILYAEGPGVVGGATSVAATSVAATTFERIYLTFTTTASGTAYFTLYNNGSVAAGTYIIAFRDALLEEGASLGDYFDGSSGSNNFVGSAWTGTADNSVSQQQDNGSPYTVTLNTTTPHGFSVGDILQVDIGLPTSATITSRSSTATLATLTIGAHKYSVGELVNVTGVSNSRYNGYFFISSVTSTTISYPLVAGATEASVASTGTVLNNTIVNGYNGRQIINAIPSATSLTYFYYNQAVPTVSTAVATNPVLTNTTNVSFNGTKTLTSASGTQFTYNL
jgi:hypothetical protein